MNNSDYETQAINILNKPRKGENAFLHSTSGVLNLFCPTIINLKCQCYHWQTPDNLKEMIKWVKYVT